DKMNGQGLWDKFSLPDGRQRKGERNQNRLNILKFVTRQVVAQRPELRKTNNHGRLCSAVFARLKQDGYFEQRWVWRKRRRTLAVHQGFSGEKVWNEKEFFYKGSRSRNFSNANYHWTRADIIRFATERQIPLWAWILIAFGGFFILKKLLK
ncbi:MAG: hypothetical protein FWC98_05630, partial [Bacteroidales bacterium]|nr:hypothetical protein [Bacteroidales bacterium]